jgi:hypothetical protein
VLAIDWSGARHGARRRIWLAEVADGHVSRLECDRDRREVVDEIIASRRSGDELVVGIDFAFSLPAWYVSTAARSAPELWERLGGGQAEEILAGCPDPFWGRPGRRRPRSGSGRPELRRTERITAELAGAAASGGSQSSPKSVFQIGGAGAVGTGSLRGMMELPRLRAAGFAIWPFDPPAFPLVLEIYPRVLTGPVVKSRAEARRAHLDLHGYRDRMSTGAFSLAVGSEDAFDAVVSALVLGDHTDDLLTLPDVADEQLRIEGIIWQPGWRERHGAPHARAPRRPAALAPGRTAR